MAVPSAQKLDFEDLALARRHAPIIRFDYREPFLPSRVGVTLFWQCGRSPSFPGLVVDIPSRAVCTIEYAIWWDWDIQHLYELEHVWVSVGEGGELVAVKGSWHGTVRRFPNWQEEDGRPILFSQPGKHAFAADPRDFPKWSTICACTIGAGIMGLLVKDLFAAELSSLKSKANDRLIRRHLRRLSFWPTFRFDQVYLFSDDALMSWEKLREYIPDRVAEVIRRLKEAV